MRFTLNNSARVFVGSKAEVRPVFGYTDGKRDAAQSVDVETGLPLWAIDAELINGDEVEALRVKVASATEPEIKARTEYRADSGASIIVSPYVNQSSGRVAYSVLVRGALIPANAAPSRPAA